jgi:hypothetical protein
MPLALPFPLPIFLAERFGLCENEDDAGVATEAPPGEEERDESDVDDLSMKDAVEESRSFDGTFD